MKKFSILILAVALAAQPVIAGRACGCALTGSCKEKGVTEAPATGPCCCSGHEARPETSCCGSRETEPDGHGCCPNNGQTETRKCGCSGGPPLWPAVQIVSNPFPDTGKILAWTSPGIAAMPDVMGVCPESSVFLPVLQRPAFLLHCALLR